jgi:hypothetical protein
MTSLNKKENKHIYSLTGKLLLATMYLTRRQTNKENDMKWTIIYNPYGDWKFYERTFDSKREAVDAVQIQIGTDSRPEKASQGFYFFNEGGQEVAVVKEDVARWSGYVKEDKA